MKTKIRKTSKAKQFIRGAIAALSQPKTRPDDIYWAKKLLTGALTEIAAQEAAEETDENGNPNPNSG
jgi:hypothetical protein